MTREEAIDAIKDAFGNSEYTDELIETLEQESVLDKIRAEIEQIEGNEVEVSDMQGNKYKYETIVKTEALQIIDKYKTKSEE